MSHYSHDDLVLYYYGEARRPDRIERHLDACGPCRAEYNGIVSALSLVDAPLVPERGEQYGLEVWQRIRHELPARDGIHWWRSIAVGAAAAVIVLVAFVAGRMGSPGRPPRAAATTAEAGPAAAERVRLDALRDHLDRSERLLVDLEHGDDLGGAQAWAGDLVESNRLYRDAAVRAGDTTTASVLDDLERQLLDIVHAPAPLTAAELDELHTRLDAAALLFKVRVLHDQLRGRQSAPASPRKTT